MPDLLERLSRTAHTLHENAAAVGEDVQSLVHAAPQAIARAPGELAAARACCIRKDAYRRRECACRAPARRAMGDRSRHPHRCAAHPAQAHPAAAAHAPAGVHDPAQPRARAVPGVEHATAIAGPAFLRRRGQAHLADPDDVRQGQGNDCWFLAAMAAVARADPASIEHLIKDLGGGRYDVTLYSGAIAADGSRAPEHFIVDNTFPADSRGRPIYATSAQVGPMGRELWPMLLEKAIAVKKHGYDGMVLTNTGLTMRLWSGLDFLVAKAGGETLQVAALSEDQVLQTVSRSLAEHRPMTSLALSELYLARHGVKSFHH